MIVAINLFPLRHEEEAVFFISASPKIITVQITSGPISTKKPDSKNAKIVGIPTGGVLDPSYSSLPCSERTEEIEASIPGYVGLTGQCVIHCGEENEFIWNIYVENPEGDCTGFDFFYPEEVE